jgi:threonine/homoserine/homoserine lactone efflux protein
MKHLYLFLLAAGLGFVAAIPIGGSQIEAAKRAIHGHLRAAWMVVLGSVSSDIMYGVVALFGIAPLLDTPGVMALFSALGAVLLWFLAYLAIRESKRPHHLKLEMNSMKSKRWAYVTGFSLAVTNPPMILIWLYGVTLAKHFGLASPFTVQSKTIFIAGGALGLGAYLAGLSLVMYHLKHFIPLKVIGRVDYWMGIGLILLSFFFVYNFVRIISKHGSALRL